MRISNKATAMVAMLAISTMGLAACSSDKSDNTNNSTPTATAPADGEKVTITYLHRLPDKDGMIKVEESAKRYNEEHKNVEVKVEKFDGDAQKSYARINQQVKAGEPAKGYCLAQVGYGEVASEYVAGDLADVSKEAAQYEKNYVDGAMGMMKLGDVTVGLPQDIGPLVYVYDQDEFDKLGIQPPKTWDEFIAAAEKAKAAGKYISTFQGDEAMYRLSGLAASNGATWFSADNDKWKVDVDGEKTMQIAEKLQTMLDKDLSLKIARWGDDWKVKMKDKTIIGTIAAGWEPGFMLGDLGVEKANWRVAPIPTMDGQPSTGSDGGSGIAVLKGCNHVKEALDFANWYNTQVKDLASQGLVVATNVEKAESPADVKKLWGDTDYLADIAQQAEHMNPNFPYLPTWPAVGAEMNALGGKIQNGEGTVADLYKGAQAKAVESMKSANLPLAE